MSLVAVKTISRMNRVALFTEIWTKAAASEILLVSRMLQHLEHPTICMLHLPATSHGVYACYRLIYGLSFAVR